MKECPPIHRRGHTSNGIDEADNPSVVFRTVNPGRHMTARLYSRDQRFESFSWIGQVMEDADRERVVERAPQRQTKNIGLNNMSIRQSARRRECHLNRIA